MGKRKRYIKGRIYIINDSLIVKNNKPNRRVVVLNNDKNNVHLRRITKCSNGGRNSRKGIPIEKYPDLRFDSVAEDKVFRKTLKGKPIKERYMKKTKTRLNKWDMAKVLKQKK